MSSKDSLPPCPQCRTVPATVTTIDIVQTAIEVVYLGETGNKLATRLVPPNAFAPIPSLIVLREGENFYCGRCGQRRLDLYRVNDRLVARSDSENEGADHPSTPEG